MPASQARRAHRHASMHVRQPCERRTKVNTSTRVTQSPFRPCNDRDAQTRHCNAPQATGTSWRLFLLSVSSGQRRHLQCKTNTVQAASTSCRPLVFAVIELHGRCSLRTTLTSMCNDVTANNAPQCLQRADGHRPAGERSAQSNRGSESHGDEEAANSAAVKHPSRKKGGFCHGQRHYAADGPRLNGGSSCHEVRLPVFGQHHASFEGSGPLCDTTSHTCHHRPEAWCGSLERHPDTPKRKQRT
ncbi:hypothetical protein NOV72_05008 [Caballeronia novacaledonica]|uniref:Uncharacterized protein n=1 Tax=Caballeronia novacaledonica TaxID=1544861 RepID=A0A2U3ICG9_9BURK|nr:hypothetical protein NOV72_05008 [Caballeronia novacaledonica]